MIEDLIKCWLFGEFCVVGGFFFKWKKIHKKTNNNVTCVLFKYRVDTALSIDTKFTHMWPLVMIGVRIYRKVSGVLGLKINHGLNCVCVHHWEWKNLQHTVKWCFIIISKQNQLIYIICIWHIFTYIFLFVPLSQELFLGHGLFV